MIQSWEKLVTDERTNRRADERMDGQTDRRTDGWEFFIGRCPTNAKRPISKR